MNQNDSKNYCNNHYTCPCCGYFSFQDPPGSYDICPICFWEDDEVQLRENWWDHGGANAPLRECQANYARFGVSELRLLDYVRAPMPEDERDSAWFPLPHPKRPVSLEPQNGSAYFEQYERSALRGVYLYYWLWDRDKDDKPGA